MSLPLEKRRAVLHAQVAAWHRCVQVEDARELSAAPSRRRFVSADGLQADRAGAIRTTECSGLASRCRR